MKPSREALDFLSGGGAMGELIRSMDWSRTSLGPPESWPQSLKTTLSLCLASNFPLCFSWGRERIQFYNDGYWPICAAKHPKSMGQDYKECWRSAWPVIGPNFERCVETGETAFVTDTRMFLDRNGYIEETFFTYSFSPIRDESGSVAGIFHPVTETTHLVLAERRMRILRLVTERTADATTVDEAIELAAQSLSEHPLDLPFVLLYHITQDGREARLVGCTGIARGAEASPERVDLATSSSGGWPLVEARDSHQVVEVEDLQARFNLVECGPYEESPKVALVCPLSLAGGESPSVLFIAGVSPRRHLDDAYRVFYALLRDAITTAVSKASAYAEEKRRAEVLAELDRAKTTFFSNVSHEFRTPLTLMLGPLEELLRRGDSAPVEGKEELQVIYRNGLRLLKLVNTLLDFSRIEAGRSQAAFEAVDLGALTAELAGQFRAAIEKAGLSFQVETRKLPSEIFVDREMWEKIVFNLLSNAFKFTFDGTIRVALYPEGDHVRLDVSDTGTGIPANMLSHIFERFHRIEGAVGRSFEGSGIGLALVQELVRMHGGTIVVESTLGKGSVFSARIRMGKQHLPPDQIVTPQTAIQDDTRARMFLEETQNWVPRVSQTDRLGLANEPDVFLTSKNRDTGDRPRILLAEDNADMRDYIRSILGANYEVRAVPNGDEALALARLSPPDLVLTDVMMPGLDGFGLLAALRKETETSDIPIIMLSARAGDEASIEGLDAGADDYLVKPFGARVLKARVRTHLELARMRKETARRKERERNADQTALQARIFDTALSNTLDFLYTFDLSGRFTYANRTLLEHWRKPFEDVVGKGFHELEYPPGLADRLHQQVQKVIATRASVRDESVHSNGGEERYYEYIFAPVMGSDGAVVAVAGSSRDVTERREAEVRLRQSEERYRSLFNSIDEGFCVIEMIYDDQDRPIDYRFLETNPVFTGLTGLSDPVGRRIRDFVPDHEDHWFETYGRVALTGVPIRFVNAAKSLEDRWYDVYALRVGDPEQRRVAILFKDITQARRAEKEREQLLEELQENERRKDKYLAMLAHELRNPLAAIQAGIEMLGMDSGPDDRDWALEMSSRQVTNLARLVDDLLDVSRITRGTIRLRMKRLRPAQVIERALVSVRHLVEQRGLQLQVLMEPRLPELMADSTRLEQVVSNLLTNAVKFSNPGGSIEVAVRESDGMIVLTVQDTGIGIAPGFLPQVFDLFAQADNSLGRENGGLGLGLTLVKTIVQLHGGSVEARSDGLGCGSELIVRLPVIARVDSDRNGIKTVEEDVSPAPNRRAGSLRILLIEDNLAYGRSLCKLLESVGHEVILAPDGPSGFEELHQRVPDLILLDLGLPGMDGFEIARQIRQSPTFAKVRIIVVSGYADKDACQRTSEIGVNRHLAKPILFSDLLRTIDEGDQTPGNPSAGAIDRRAKILSPSA